MNEKAKIIIKMVLTAVVAAATAVLSMLGLQSCNVTRTITNESSYLTKGDTSVIIHTKTIERYDAKKSNASSINQ